MGVQCRCFNRINGKVCFTRKSLAKHPRQYVEVRNQPKCPSCGGRQWHVDKYRIKVELTYARSCDCGGYHFIHRKGSKYCYHHPQAEQHHTERYEK